MTSEATTKTENVDGGVLLLAEDEERPTRITGASPQPRACSSRVTLQRI
jgi:hypothetical protein